MEDYKSDSTNVLLIQAAENKNWKQVWGLLEEGADPNAMDENGFRLIQLSIFQENLNALDLVIDYGASVENVPGILQLSRDKENDWLCILFSRGNFGVGAYFRPAQRSSGHYEMPIENWSGTKSLTLVTEEGNIDAFDYVIDSGTKVDDIPGAVSCGNNLLRAWLTRGDGEMLYWRLVEREPARYGELSEENQTVRRRIVCALLESLPSIITELFPRTRLSKKQEAEPPEKSNDAEVRHDHATEIYTEPERCAVPALNEDTPFTLGQENLAEVKDKKAKKRRKAHRRKWSSRDGDPKQQNFFNELGFENI